MPTAADEPQGLPARFYRKRDVVSLTALSDASIRRLEIAGNFPRRVRLTPRLVVWPAGEVDAWIANIRRPSIH